MMMVATTQTVSGYDTYRIFNSIKLHYSSRFDVSKYGYFASSLNPRQYETQNKHKRIYEAVGNKFQSIESMTDYFGAALCYHNRFWIEDILNDDCYHIYRRLKKFKSNIEYHSLKELETLMDKYNGFKPLFNPHEHSTLFSCLVTEASAETVIALNEVFPVYDTIDQNQNLKNPLWNQKKILLSKYRFFVIAGTSLYNSRAGAKKFRDEISDKLKNRI